MIKCIACNEEFETREKYDEHWKYILNIPQKNEIAKILKKEFPNLDLDIIIEIASKILEIIKNE